MYFCVTIYVRMHVYMMKRSDIDNEPFSENMEITW